MAYITLYNVKKIIFNSDIKNIDLNGVLYKIPIYFFSKYEENELLAIQELLKNPEKYFFEIYIPYKPIDTYTLVYEGLHPSYHSDPTCERLISKYENFVIPEEIRKRGIAVVVEFRKWFETVKYLLLTQPDAFVARLYARWSILTNPNAISKENSGSTDIEELTIEELEKKIDTKIKDAGRFYYKNDKNKAILKQFSKYTFLAYKSELIDNNSTGYSDSEVKALLMDYNEEFKKPLKKMLIEYYRLKHNPEIKMEGDILEKLGFRPCRRCYDENFEEDANQGTFTPIEPIDVLPF